MSHADTHTREKIAEFLESQADFIEWQPDFLVDDDDDEFYEEDQTTIELTEPQTRFIMLEAKFPLFLAGFGAGKSTTMALNILRDLRYFHKRPIKIGAFCPTYDLLKLITIPYLCEFLENSGVGYKLNKSDYIITIETGDQIILRSMDNPGRIVGFETFRSHVDEIDTLEKLKAKEAWLKIIGRNRQKVFKYGEDSKIIKYLDGNGNIKKAMNLNKVSAYTTAEGFEFCYETWEKNPTKDHITVQAPTYSNPNLPPEYVQNLYDNYSSELVDAYVEGRYVNMKSGSVYPGFCRIKNNTREKIKPGEMLQVGMDFNVGKMFATIGVTRLDVAYVLDEISEGLDTPSVCKILKERYPNNSIVIYPDASGNNKSAKCATESDISIIRSFGFRVKKDKKNPFIKDRVISLQTKICNHHDKRELFINVENCPNTTECIEQQVWDKNGQPDKTSDRDHANDALGYWVYQCWAVKRNKISTNTVSLFAR